MSTSFSRLENACPNRLRKHFRNIPEILYCRRFPEKKFHKPEKQKLTPKENRREPIEIMSKKTASNASSSRPPFSRKNLRFALPILALFLLFLILFFLTLQKNMAHKADHALLRTSSYNSVFLSMFPIDTYDKEDYSHFRGDDILLLNTILPDHKALKHDLTDVLASGNELRVIYLGVDPEKITGEQILALSAQFPDSEIEVLPWYRPLSDWTADGTNTAKRFEAYYKMVTSLAGLEKIHIYSFFANEWLIANPEAYQSSDRIPRQINETAAHLLYLYTDDLHGCQIQPETVHPLFDEFSDLLAKAKKGEISYPDLSGRTVVFFGDSVIGNTTDFTSIPWLLSAFTGAECYNCGVGGSTAVPKEAFPYSVNEILKIYLSGNPELLPEEINARTGLTSLFAAHSKESLGSGKDLLFVLHYGLNDYFEGRAVESEDPKDPASYCGALRLAVETLKKAHPDAKILLIAPNFTNYFEYGTLINSEEGSVYTDYIDAVSHIAAEYSLPLLDDYHNVITPDNAARYLGDGCHPNEAGRFRIAQELAWLLGNQ